jgi:hypothetical protein
MPTLPNRELFDRTRGCVIAIATLTACVRTQHANGPRGTPLGSIEQELALGDFTPGRWAWLLADVGPLRRPIPATGSLGLWTWDAPTWVMTLIGAETGR